MPCLLRCHRPCQHAHTCAHTCWQARVHVASPRLLPVLCTTRQRLACRRSPPPLASSASPPQSCWQPRGCPPRPSSRQPCSLPSQRACSSPLKKSLVSEGGNSATGRGAHGLPALHEEASNHTYQRCSALVITAITASRHLSPITLPCLAPALPLQLPFGRSLSGGRP
jgi:hypothetical protein